MIDSLERACQASRLRMETVDSGMAICDLGIVPLLSGFVWESSDSCTHRIGLITFEREVCRSAWCGKSARYVRCGGRWKRNHGDS